MAVRIANRVSVPLPDARFGVTENLVRKPRMGNGQTRIVGATGSGCKTTKRRGYRSQEIKRITRNKTVTTLPRSTSGGSKKGTKITASGYVHLTVGRRELVIPDKARHSV